MMRKSQRFGAPYFNPHRIYYWRDYGMSYCKWYEKAVETY